jgi:hypothetical protein
MDGKMKKPDIKKANWVIQFLEGDISIDSLINDPDETVRLAEGLIKNFLNKNEAEMVREMIPSKRKVKTAKRLLKNPKKINVVHQIMGTPVKNIHSYYINLKPVWEQFKKISLFIEKNIFSPVSFRLIFQLKSILVKRV